MQLIARPRGKLQPEEAFLRPASQPDPGVKHPFSGPFKPATHPVTGGMSYGKLPSGAWALIRSLRVSTLENRYDTESNISPTMNVYLLKGIRDPRRA